MLRLDRLLYQQGDFSLAADLGLERGAFCAVIGPSGAGKSTLLDLIAGFIAPESGRVMIGGADVTGAPPGERPVSMLFQENNLFPHLDAFGNIALGLSPSRRLTEAQRREAAEALAAVGLEGMELRKPSQLSGGQRRRVALARALARRRPVLLLDEPFSALGPALRREMLALTDRIRRERELTVLLVTHDPEEARRADLVSVVAEGRVSPPTPPEALFANPPPGLADYL